MLNIREIADRIKNLRELLNLTPEEMADVTGCTPADYAAYESGERDLSFTFLHKCAEKFGIDIVELMTGDSPKLSTYTVTRAGEGLPLSRREGFVYQHVSYLLKNKYAEPFIVTAPYREQEQNAPIALSTHEGQEFDYILEGSMKVELDGHTELLNEGDCIYYDTGKPHGKNTVSKKPYRLIAFDKKKR